MKTVILTILAVFLLIAWTGCSGVNQPDPIIPEGSERPVMQETNPNGSLTLMSYWEISIDLSTGEASAVQVRSTEQLLNVLCFMEPPSLLYLTVDWETLVLDDVNNKVEVVARLRHPLTEPTNVFMGFDVRGIVFGPELVNADGYTPLLAPDAFKDIPFGYMDGLLGAPESFAHYSGDVWPYKYFAKGMDPYESVDDFYSNPDNLANRGQFPESCNVGRFYHLDFGDDPSDYLVFNYAVLASFDWPVGDSPYDLDDFPIATANTPEPFNVRFDNIESDLFYVTSNGSGGGSLSMDVEVFDWQGANDLLITIASEDGITIPETPATSFDLGLLPYSTMYHFENIPGNPTGVGTINLVLRAVDPDVTYGDAWMFGQLPPGHPLFDVPVYSMFMTQVEVEENFPPMWNPELFLAPGYETTVRSGMPYSDEHSNYDSVTRFTYTGLEPEDQNGEWSKYFYVSTSAYEQTGSPVGWDEFTTVGYFDIDWSDYDSIAPAGVYVWVKAEDEYGASSPVIRWDEGDGIMELCKLIAGWDDDFSNDWYPGGNSVVGTWLIINVGTSGTDSYVYSNKSWILGDTETTSSIKVEFSRRPIGWHINSNEFELRVSDDGGTAPLHPIASWAGSWPMGGPYLVTLTTNIAGQSTIASTRTFGWHMKDASSVGFGIAYIDYMGIYAHPL